jgi:two-component system chemotaxis sensor kinase CheA
MDMSKFKAMFLTESAEHLRSMSTLLTALEGQPQNREGIDALFREAHSIKGMAASMGYERMARLAHHLEDTLDGFRKQGEISPAAVGRLLSGVDLLEDLREDISDNLPERDIAEFIEQGGDRFATSGEQTLEPPAAEGALHVALNLQDNVVAPAVRLLLIVKQLEVLGAVEQLSPDLEELSAAGRDHRQLQLRLKTGLTPRDIEQAFADYPEISQLRVAATAPAAATRGQDRRRDDRRRGDRRQQGVAGATVRVDTALLDRFINLTGELVTNRHRLQTALGAQNWRELNEGLGQLGKLVQSLHGQVLQVRMTPVGSITERLPRVVRDLCRKNGKDVQLLIEGAEIELDRTILEEMADPLMHLVRNAVDHGIVEQGTIQLRIWRERSHVQIQIQDDGRGIDPQKIRQRAVEKGLLSARQAQALRTAEVLQLICRPGFSTTEQVTETSGRGVGMDVVKAAVEKLGGILLIDSTLGRGSRITMQLPLSVAIIRVLLLECDGKLLALPLSRILQTRQIERQELRRSGKQLLIQLKDETLPLLSLRKILGMPVPPAAARISLVVMKLFGRKVGLAVDRLVGHREVFVKKLPPPFDRLRGSNGGAVLGDGQVVFILDVQSFLERRR